MLYVLVGLVSRPVSTVFERFIAAVCLRVSEQMFVSVSIIEVYISKQEIADGWYLLLRHN